MTVDLMKERLHLRIEQADEKMLHVLTELAESLFKNYQQQAFEQDDEVASSAAYKASLKPMTVEDLIARAKESNLAIADGEHVDIEEALLTLGD
jgi:hypothetical protein